jgi:hypothetical protein
MILTTLALAWQLTPELANQKWKFDAGMVGEIPSPPTLGPIKDPIIYGEFSLINETTPDKTVDAYQLSLKIKRDQSPLVKALTGGINQSKIGPKNDKDYVYISEVYAVNKSNLSIDHAVGSDSSQSEEILNPLAIGIALSRRSMSAPVLKTEYLLMKQGPRFFYAIFSSNPSANIDERKGEAAYRFDIVLKERNQIYPKFFQGAVRVNTKTQRVMYIRATSSPSDGPQVDGVSLYESVKSFAINLVAKD